MPASASRRRGTSPSFWNRYNTTQDSLVSACMPTLSAPMPPLAGSFGRDRTTRAVHPDFSDRKVYSA